MFTNDQSLVKTQEMVQGHRNKWKELRLRRLSKTMGEKLIKLRFSPYERNETELFNNRSS